MDPRGQGRRLRQRRLDRLLADTLRASPLYARRACHARVLADIEPIGKHEPMQHFDDRATDRRITRAGAEQAMAAAEGGADAWLDRDLFRTSSGTRGHPGIFVQDAASLGAFDAIDALGLRGSPSGLPGLPVWGLGGTVTLLPLAVEAVIAHDAGITQLQLLRRPDGALEGSNCPHSSRAAAAAAGGRPDMQPALSLRGAGSCSPDADARHRLADPQSAAGVAAYSEHHHARSVKAGPPP